jgi:hypothetical protein
MPTEAPKEEPEVSTPTEEPKEEPEDSTPTEAPKEEPEVSTPTEEPKEEPENSTPTEAPKEEPEVSTPTEEPKEIAPSQPTDPVPTIDVSETSSPSSAQTDSEDKPPTDDGEADHIIPGDDEFIPEDPVNSNPTRLPTLQKVKKTKKPINTPTISPTRRAHPTAAPSKRSHPTHRPVPEPTEEPTSEPTTAPCKCILETGCHSKRSLPCCDGLMCVDFRWFSQCLEPKYTTNYMVRASVYEN